MNSFFRLILSELAALKRLTLAELACSSRLLETRLFTLFHSWVSCQETSCLQCRSVSFLIDFAECSCDAVSEGSGLACESAAVYCGDDVKAAECACEFERSSYFVLDDVLFTKVSVDVSLVDDDVTCAWEKSDSGYR